MHEGMVRFLISCAVGIFVEGSALASLSVSEREGAFSVIRDGRTVVASAGEEVGDRSMEGTMNAFVRLADGSLSVTLPKELLGVYVLVRLM